MGGNLTDKELRKLSRIDLLELLLEKSRENEKLKEELEQVKAKLADRKINIEKAGSIAQAALALNGVFQAAQAAADQYLENLRRISGETDSVQDSTTQISDSATEILEKTTQISNEKTDIPDNTIEISEETKNEE